jgi:hypothetical protein
MTVSPVGARCRRCGEDFHLFELLDDRTGRCPRCSWSLSPDWTPKLLGDAVRVDTAQQRFVSALRSLRDVPGNVALRPHTVLRNMFEEVGWHRDLAEDPDLLQDELSEVRQLLIDWERLDPLVAAAQPRPSWLRRVGHWLKGSRPQPRWHARPQDPGDGSPHDPRPDPRGRLQPLPAPIRAATDNRH